MNQDGPNPTWNLILCQDLMGLISVINKLFIYLFLWHQMQISDPKKGIFLINAVPWTHFYPLGPELLH